MAYRFEIDPVNKILAVRFEGDITFSSLKRFYYCDARRMFEIHPDLRGSIVDFTGATALAITPDDVRELASSPPVDPDPARMRVVVAPSSHIFGLCRMFELHGEETRPNLHVVASLAQAYVLLGIKNPIFEPVADPPAK
ncbi:MAG: hypothetical protein WA766_10545 [Candidatus Acidiferrales bacterium]